MRSLRHASWAIMGLLLGMTVVVGGCGGGDANSPPASSPATTASNVDDQAVDDLMEHHRHHHHGGVTMFIAMSIDTLGVSAEQKTAIERIQTDLYAKMEPARAAEQAVTNLVADGVAAGTIDQAKVDAALAQAATASAGVHEASADALNQLHAALTPEQRGALADKVEAHWDLWKKANSAEEQASTPEHHGHLEQVARDLALSPDQIDKVRASFGDRMRTGAKLDPAQVDAHVHEFGEAFRGATFDAKTLQHGGGASSQLAGWGARRMVHFYTALTPVLTPEQRTKLAASLHEHANRHENG